MLALSGAVFLAAGVYVGYASELLKDVISSWHRFALCSGFLMGAASVSRWIMALELQRNMSRIRQARSSRKKVR